MTPPRTDPPAQHTQDPHAGPASSEQAPRPATPHPDARSATPASSDDLDRLLRWQAAGGTWQVTRRSQAALTVALLRCDGAEEADRFTSGDQALLGHVAGRDCGEGEGS